MDEFEVATNQKRGAILVLLSCQYGFETSPTIETQEYENWP